MLEDDRRTMWETYVAAWKEPSAEGKRRALLASVQPHGVYRDPLTQAEGHDALVAYMTAFHQQIPGGHFETIRFLAHHDRSLAEWTMRNGEGAIVGTGTSYGEYDGQGKLVAMTGFFEAPGA